MNIKSTSPSYRIYLISSILCAILSVLGDKFNTGILDYALFFMFIILSVMIVIPKGLLLIPKNYLIVFITFIVLMVINSTISPYTVGTKYVAIGSVITLLPFLVFIISYNYNLSITNINKLIDVWIYMILSLCIISFIETFVIKTNVFYQEAILKISFIKPGFFASLCNQGIILSLFRFASTHLAKYKKLIIFFTICCLLTIQLKVIVSLFIIWIIYLYIFKAKRKRTLIIILLFIISFGYVLITNIPPINDKVNKYTTLYGANDSYEGIARPALYYQSVNIANDFFPLGSGQGTFGSVPVNMVYNQIYYDYNLYYIYGLGETGINFKMDTHWSSILGENGYLGTLLYLILFLYPITFLKRLTRNPDNNPYRFIIITTFTVITIESVTLCIPGRMAFMFIYSGIIGLICRQISQRTI